MEILYVLFDQSFYLESIIIYLLFAAFVINCISRYVITFSIDFTRDFYYFRSIYKLSISCFRSHPYVFYDHYTLQAYIVQLCCYGI